MVVFMASDIKTYPDIASVAVAAGPGEALGASHGGGGGHRQAGGGRGGGGGQALGPPSGLGVGWTISLSG